MSPPVYLHVEWKLQLQSDIVQRCTRKLEYAVKRSKSDWPDIRHRHHCLLWIGQSNRTKSTCGLQRDNQALAVQLLLDSPEFIRRLLLPSLELYPCCAPDSSNLWNSELLARVCWYTRSSVFE